MTPVVTRGQKLCKNCQTVNGVRSFSCKNCNHPFVMKNSSDKADGQSVGTNNKPVRRKRMKPRFLKEKVSNWKSLHCGDTIKIKFGPFFLNEETGERMYLNSGGVVTVCSMIKNGFWARYQKRRKDCGEFFVYMGDREPSPVIPSLTRQRHKLVKIIDTRAVSSN